MIAYDLHIHSTASDGVLFPNEICQIASVKGLKGIALTDHDTVSALEECSNKAKEWKLDFVPGIEISCDYLNYEVHVLGYFIDYNNSSLLDFLNLMQITRENRNYEIVKKLQKLGYSVEYDEIIKQMDDSNMSVGRPHIARALVGNGYFKCINDVFLKLLGDSKAAYVSREKISIGTASETILRAGGVPIIAHPLINGRFSKNIDVEYFIKTSIASGIMGIEVFHTLHNETQEKYLLEIAKKYNLVITGGSDCHGEKTNDTYLLGSRGITLEAFNRFKEKSLNTN